MLHLYQKILSLALIFFLNGCVNSFFDALDPFEDDYYGSHQNVSRSNPQRNNPYRPNRRSGGSKQAYGKRPYSEFDAYKQEVFRLTNYERQRVGLPPLRSAPVLKRIADIRAVEISKYFSHDRPNGRSWDSLLSQFRVGWRFCGENIAMGQDNPKKVMSSWMHSSGHRANILGSQYTHIGIGVTRRNGRLCWTQNFLTFK